jgi:hypothetical protein
MSERASDTSGENSRNGVAMTENQGSKGAAAHPKAKGRKEGSFDGRWPAIQVNNNLDLSVFDTLTFLMLTTSTR